MKISALFLVAASVPVAFARRLNAIDDYGLRAGTCPTATSDAYTGDKCEVNSDCPRNGECCLSFYCICGKTNSNVGNVPCVPGPIGPPPTNAPLTNPPPTNPPPTNAPPTNAPPTNAPPTRTPPTNAVSPGTPPTNAVSPTNAPPTNPPPTNAPPTNAPPTNAPPTNAPPTNAPPTGTPPTNAPGNIDCGVPNTCTSSVLNTAVGTDSTCQASIEWTMTTYGKTQEQACYQVANDDYPTECGGCNPGGNGFIEYSFNCGSTICNDQVLNNYAGSNKCGDRITYLRNAMGESEEAACAKVAGDEFPLECGACIEQVITCGDATTCTSAVLDSISDGNGAFTCRDRITFVVQKGSTELDACDTIANEPANAAVCGPCEP